MLISIRACAVCGQRPVGWKLQEELNSQKRCQLLCSIGMDIVYMYYCCDKELLSSA